MNEFDLRKGFDHIRGKTVAVVYIFEGEDAPGFSHYHIWKSDVISGWLNAIQLLDCRPFILDVRTFVEKALSNTLPHIDFVINLNCGSTELSPMGLVPSTCAFLGIPCIPCDTTGVVVGENKKLSNMIASYIGLSVPREIDNKAEDGLYRPLNYGSSFGVRHGPYGVEDENGLFQEFIPGFDITTPYVYNPLTGQMNSLPTILYIPTSGSTQWFFGEQEKEQHSGYTREIIHGISPELDNLYQDLIRAFNVGTYCRIDARIRGTDGCAYQKFLDSPLSSENLYFIEINNMPTVRGDNSFVFSFNSICDKDHVFEYLSAQKRICGAISPNSFLLSSAMLSHLKAKC